MEMVGAGYTRRKFGNLSLSEVQLLDGVASTFVACQEG